MINFITLKFYIQFNEYEGKIIDVKKLSPLTQISRL